MFVLTDSGKQELKHKQAFKYKEHLFAIVEVPEKFNLSLLRVIHYNSGRRLPINFCAEKTLKKHVETALQKLEQIEKRLGVEAFEKELIKFETINTKLSGKWKILNT